MRKAVARPMYQDNIRYVAIVRFTGRTTNKQRDHNDDDHGKPVVLVHSTSPTVKDLSDAVVHYDESSPLFGHREKFDFQKHVDRILLHLQDIHQGQNVTSIFKIEESGQWLVETDDEGNTFVVITKPDYPTYVASECVDELARTFLEAGCKTNRIARKQLRGEIAALLIKYDDLESVSTVWKEMMTVERQVVAQLNENIQAILKNCDGMVDGGKLVELSQETLELSNTFKKRVCVHEKKQQGHRKTTYMVVGVVGACVGVTVGILVGVPIAVAMLAAHHTSMTLVGVKAVEATVGGTIGVVVGTSTSCAVSSLSKRSFWSKRFVPFAAGAIVGYKYGKKSQGV